MRGGQTQNNYGCEIWTFEWKIDFLTGIFIRVAEMGYKRVGDWN